MIAYDQCHVSGMSTLTHTGKCAESTNEEWAGSSGPFLVDFLHCLTDDVPDSVGGILLHLCHGVSAGVQGEAH